MAKTKGGRIMILYPTIIIYYYAPMYLLREVEFGIVTINCWGV